MSITLLLDKLFRMFGYRICANIPLYKSYAEYLDIQIASKYSMCSLENLEFLSRAIGYINDNNIEGDFVEFGTYKGGCALLMRLRSPKRTLYVFDTFNGMPYPGPEDINYKGKKAKYKRGWCKYSYFNFEENLGQLIRNVIVYEGPIEEKIFRIQTEKIALARLDTDFYSSTKVEIEKVWPLLTQNGILIIDDYGHWLGARKAINEYFKSINYKPMIFNVDSSCVAILKI